MDFDELYDDVYHPNPPFKYFDNIEPFHSRIHQQAKQKVKGNKKQLNIFQNGEDEDYYEQQQVRSPQFGQQVDEEELVANIEVVKAVYENYQQNHQYQQLDSNVINNRKILQNQQQLDQKSKVRREKIKENHQRMKKLRDQQKLADKIEKEIKEQKQYDLEVKGIDHDKIQNRKASSCSQSIVRKKNMVNMTQRLIQLKHVADNYYPTFLKRYYGMMAFRLLIQLKQRYLYLADRQYEKWLKKHLVQKIKQALYQTRIDRKILESQKEFKINQYRYSVLIPKCFNVWLDHCAKKQKKLDIYRKFRNKNVLRKVLRQIYQHCLQSKDLKKQNQKLKSVQTRRQNSINKIKEIQQYNQNAKTKLKYI